MLKQKHIRYFMRIAKEVASLSTCYNRKVGAVIVSPDKRILATGYNGTPSKMVECQDIAQILKLIYDNYYQPNRQAFTIDNLITILTKLIRLIQYDIYDSDEIGRILENQVNEYGKEQIELTYLNMLTYIENELLLKQTEINDILQNTDLSFREFNRLFNYIHSQLEVHAEQNALIQCVKYGIQIPEGSYIFCTTFPCSNCSKLIVSSGIRTIYYIEYYPDFRSLLFLKQNNVRLVQVSEEELLLKD